MKSHTKHLTFHTRERMELVNITSQVESEARASGVKEGLDGGRDKRVMVKIIGE
jgi:thiamine phosphate synthase YjbQ (UPF0047 family)